MEWEDGLDQAKQRVEIEKKWQSIQTTFAAAIGQDAPASIRYKADFRRTLPLSLIGTIDALLPDTVMFLTGPSFILIADFANLGYTPGRELVP